MAKRAMTLEEWATQAFSLLHKEWVHVMPNSTRDKMLRDFLLAAPVEIKAGFIQTKDKRERKG